MGTLNYHVGKGGTNRGTGAASTLRTDVRTSDAFTTSTSPAFVEDAAGDITLAKGELIQVYASEAMRISFGDVPATTDTGIYIPAEQQREYEAHASGKVSIVDVA